MTIQELEHKIELHRQAEARYILAGLLFHAQAARATIARYEVIIAFLVMGV